MNGKAMYQKADVRPTTSEEFVYHALRTDILTGVFRPGERIVQAECAQRLGVSVTPVREALRRLQSERIVEMVAHIGATVRQLTISDAREIYRLRIILEPLAVKDAIQKVSIEAIAEAKRLQKMMGGTDDLSMWLDYNRAFHELFVDPSDSWTGRILDMLRAAAAPFVGLSLLGYPEIRNTSNVEHQELISAFESKDADSVMKVIESHLHHTITALEKAHDEMSLL